MLKEIATLDVHDCFECKPPGHQPDFSHQKCNLHMIFDVKQCRRFKAQLVAGGHQVDPGNLSTRATVMKGVSIRLLDVIAHHCGLKTLCGDVGNAFIDAHTKEKVWAVTGPKFRDREGCVTSIKKALCGSTTSTERWRACFADHLQKMGFEPTCHNRDVWPHH